MKVCVLTNMHPIKDDRIYYKQVLSLVKEYPHITLVAPEENENPRDLHPSVRFIPLRKAPGIIGRLWSIVSAAITVRKINPDVCHFHDFDLILMAPLLKAFKNVRLIYDSHEAYPQMFSLSSRIPFFLRNLSAITANVVEKGLARLCALVVTADEATTASFRKYQLPSATIYNFPPLDIFKPNPELETELKDRYAGRVVLIYQGTMGEHRGLYHMLRAIKDLHRQDPSILLLLIGLDDPKLHREATETIQSLSIVEAVEIIPWVSHEDIGAYMRCSHIGLIPWQPTEKHMMNVPIKLFEYMACGLPILSADLPPIARFLRESGAGWLYDSTDDQALVRGVRKMMADSNALEDMARKGIEAVVKKWNWTVMEQRLLNIYKKIEISRNTGNRLRFDV